MRGIEWQISPSALLIFALMYFFDGSGIFAMLLPAVLAHEAGHAVLLRCTGMEIRRVTIGIFGLEMDYSGSLRGLRGAAAIAAGPVFGLVYAALSMFSGSEFWRLSGSVSIALSAFNLMPVMPLDGGRLLMLATGERALAISRVISLALVGLGCALWISRGWFSLFAMGVWLAWYNYKIKNLWSAKP